MAVVCRPGKSATALIFDPSKVVADINARILLTNAATKAEKPS